MKTILALILCTLFIGCQTAPNLTQPAAYFATAKLLENSNPAKRPSRVTALRTASKELVRLADTGTVSREAIESVLNLSFGSDPEFTAVRMVVMAYAPEGVKLATPEKLAALRNVALGINAALPAEVQK